MKIERLGIEDADTVFDWVMRLLVELGEEGEELGKLAKDKVLQDWRRAGDRYQVFVAKNGNDILGILTLSETFAIYANGSYGVIDEMYVAPAHRSSGVGSSLIKACLEYGVGSGWSRIDVTAPESNRWDRSRQFYEKEGFVFTGPKLKYLLK